MIEKLASNCDFSLCFIPKLKDHETIVKENPIVGKSRDCVFDWKNLGGFGVQLTPIKMFNKKEFEKGSKERKRKKEFRTKTSVPLCVFPHYFNFISSADFNEVDKKIEICEGVEVCFVLFEESVFVCIDDEIIFSQEFGAFERIGCVSSFYSGTDLKTLFPHFFSKFGARVSIKKFGESKREKSGEISQKEVLKFFKTL